MPTTTAPAVCCSSRGSVALGLYILYFECIWIFIFGLYVRCMFTQVNMHLFLFNLFPYTENESRLMPARSRIGGAEILKAQPYQNRAGLYWTARAHTAFLDTTCLSLDPARDRIKFRKMSARSCSGGYGRRKAYFLAVVRVFAQLQRQRRQCELRQQVEPVQCQRQLLRRSAVRQGCV